MYLAEVCGGVGWIRVEGNHMLLKCTSRMFKIEYMQICWKSEYTMNSTCLLPKTLGHQ